MSPDELKAQFEKLNQRFCSFINAQYRDFLTAGGKNDMIVVAIEKPLTSDADIERLIDVLDSMLQAYLVSAKGKTV